MIRPISTPSQLHTGSSPSTYLDPYKREQPGDRRSNPEPYRPSVSIIFHLFTTVLYNLSLNMYTNPERIIHRADTL